LFRRADPALVTTALESAEHVIVIDCLDNPTADHAHLVFPAASVAESTGTLVNYEHRAQRFYQVFVAQDNIQPGWRWLAAYAKALGTNNMGWNHVDDVLQDLAGQPGFADITKVAPSADYRSTTGQKVPRETHRYSGRTAMNADTTLHEPKTKVDEETPFSYSMEGLNADQPSSLIPYVWSPGWNSNQSVFKFQQEIGGELRGGAPGVHLSRQSEGRPLPTPVKQLYANNDESSNAFTLIPAPALFGSEELSAYSPSIEQRMPTPFVVVHPEDAARLGVAAGDGILCDGHSLEVRIHSAMARKTAAVPTGLPNAPSFLSEQPVTLARDDNFVRRPTIIARG
jgi:NADH-quinone oxidoreductase subunit G